MTNQKEQPRFNQGNWIFGLLLFIPINLIVGMGLLFSIGKTIIPLFSGDIQSVSLVDTLSLIVCIIFISFNVFYLFKTYKNLRNIKGIWLIICPIVISFIEYAGCIPSFSSYM